MTDINGRIAGRLRALRQANGWSLDRAAQATGVSKAMLGQIERGESSPTVATLWKIAAGFDISFSALLEDAPQADGVLLRSSAGGDWPTDDGSIQVRSLFPYDPALGIEFFVIELQPGACHQSEAHAAGVTEHVIPVSGSLEVCVDGRWHALAGGEGLRFAADRPHAYRNSGREPVLFHNLIHYRQTRPLPCGPAAGAL
ncbi:HTH-type transcriptional regulator SinR [compost metagenome]